MVCLRLFNLQGGDLTVARSESGSDFIGWVPVAYPAWAPASKALHGEREPASRQGRRGILANKARRMGARAPLATVGEGEEEGVDAPQGAVPYRRASSHDLEDAGRDIEKQSFAQPHPRGAAPAGAPAGGDGSGGAGGGFGGSDGDASVLDLFGSPVSAMHQQHDAGGGGAAPLVAPSRVVVVTATGDDLSQRMIIMLLSIASVSCSQAFGDFFVC